MMHDYSVIMSLMSAEAQERELRNSTRAAYGDYTLALVRALETSEALRRGEDDVAMLPRRMSAFEQAKAAVAHARKKYETLYNHWGGATIDIYHLKHGHPFREDLTDDERSSVEVPVLRPATPSRAR